MLKEIILKLAKLPDEQLTNEVLHDIKKEVARKHNVTNLPTNIQLQKTYQQMVEN